MTMLNSELLTQLTDKLQIEARTHTVLGWYYLMGTVILGSASGICFITEAAVPEEAKPVVRTITLVSGAITLLGAFGTSHEFAEGSTKRNFAMILRQINSEKSQE